MIGFLGEFEVTLDTKGRFSVPVGFKRQLTKTEGNKFILNRGFDKCLTLYTEKQWEKVASVVNRMNDFNEKSRKFKRVFLNGATILEPDSAGRLLVPKTMCEHAGITKDIIFSAQMNKVELWDAETYKKQTAADVVDMNALASEVLGSDFLNPFDNV
jgi:MraZ protein